MNDITALMATMKAAAENATPGEWCNDDRHGVIADAGLNGNFYIASCSGPEHRSNAQFIAKASPANVLALVEALEKAQSERDKYRSRLSVAKLFVGNADNRIAELESRTVTVKLRKRSVGEVMHMSGFSRDYAEGWCSGNDNAINEMKLAGIQVIEGEGQ